MQNLKLVDLLLRISIASVLIYAAISILLQPDIWIWYFPPFLRDTIPNYILLKGFVIYQLILGLWILSGKKTFYAGFLSSITFAGIIVSNFEALDIVFRDFAIFFASVALTIGHFRKHK